MRLGRGRAWPEVVAALVAAMAFAFVHWSGRSAPATFVLVPPDPTTLRLVTWNVGQGVDRGASGLMHDQVESIVERIVELEAEVVLLQELSSMAQARRLARRLRAATNDSWDHKSQRATNGRYLCALSTRSVLDVTSADESPALVAQIDVRPGETLWIANLHASAFDAAERNLEVGRAVDWLLAREGDPRVAGLFLFGDLNLDLDIGTRGDVFTDDRHADVETYAYATRRFRDFGLHAGPTAEPDRRLDYCLGQTRYVVTQAGPWREARLPGMDHHPLVVDLQTR